jgi:DNA-binding NtrC family response regulator
MNKRTANILVVDDEAQVRRMAEFMLQTEGYRVYTAENATRALEVAQELQCGLNLLITDMVMPGIDGHELILTIRRICPHMDTMVITGFVPGDTRQMNYPILPKPFTRDQLIGAVKTILDAQI